MKKFADKIREVLTVLPQLTANGIGLGKVSCNENEFKEAQDQLLKEESKFEKLCLWLDNLEKIKTVNERHSSYGLKHIAEKDLGYITNGLFIAAAVYSGFKYKTFPGSLNVSFAISERSIKRIESNRCMFLVNQAGL